MTENGGFWGEESIIKDMIFNSNSTIADISREIGLSYPDTRKKIKAMGLDWAANKNRKYSKGHSALTEIFKTLLPGYEIVTEHPLDNGLFLDIYCPRLKLGAEYHGRQHFFYSNLFHKDRYAFERGIENDEKKIEYCKKNGISLVTFRFSDKLTQDSVADRIVEAIKACKEEVSPKPSKSLRDDEFYQRAKAFRNQKRREAYKRMKEARNKK